MPRIGLVVHPEREAAKELAQRARLWWEERGFDVVEPHDHNAPDPDFSKDLAFAISLGGDGTMLRTVQLVVQRGIPVLGINLGSLGYLTLVEPLAMEHAFDRMIRGDFLVEERMALEVTLEDSPRHGARTFTVLNEVALDKTEPGRTIRVDVSISGRSFLTYVADGLIVATPTGSTAYNLSLRGPVLTPTLKAIVITPVSPHMLFDRSLVLGPKETVRLEVLEDRPAVLVVDGSITARMEIGSAVSVRKSRDVVRIIDFSAVNFHEVLRTKFGLVDR